MHRYEPLAFECSGVGEARVDWESGFRLDDQRIARGLGTSVSPRLSDLLDVAMAAYVTDRVRRRRPIASARSIDSWSRRLPVRLAVRDPGFWQRSTVIQVLAALLGWLTDDDWCFEFVAGRDKRRWAETQVPLFAAPVATPASFGLFSGGLDSFLGAAHDLQVPDGELVLVSASSSQNMQALQQRTIAALASHRRRAMRSVIVPIGVRRDTLTQLQNAPRETPEPSQRTRGFVFLVLGAVTAATAGARELRVYENGIGAMNLPLTEAQYGSLNTRAMRPETLALAGRLFSHVVEQPFLVVNPSFALTKAQLCQRAAPVLRVAMSATVSCDTGLTHRASRTHLCGTCTSCLLRRQALRASGLDERDDVEAGRYRCDVRRISTSTDTQLQRLHYMLNQAAQLATGLSADDPVNALMREFPDLMNIHRCLRDSGVEGAEDLTTGLFERYIREWQHFGHPLVERYLSNRGDVRRAA